MAPAWLAGAARAAAGSVAAAGVTVALAQPVALSKNNASARTESFVTRVFMSFLLQKRSNFCCCYYRKRF
jgi:hypothetical protein